MKKKFWKMKRNYLNEIIVKNCLDFKNITKDIIDEFINNCESEKEKGIMIEKEILENEKKLFK